MSKLIHVYAFGLDEFDDTSFEFHVGTWPDTEKGDEDSKRCMQTLSQRLEQTLGPLAMESIELSRCYTEMGEYKDAIEEVIRLFERQ